MKATITKTIEAQKMGNYTETKVDLLKKEVDFVIINMNPIWVSFKNNGFRGEISKKQLKVYQQKYTWSTNF
jgi:hypothetical protein